jgi:hypothetical protein
MSGTQHELIMAGKNGKPVSSWAAAVGRGLGPRILAERQLDRGLQSPELGLMAHKKPSPC